MENKKKGKKSQMMTLMIIILMLIVLIILFFIFKNIFFSGKNITDTEACRLSALAKANLKIPITGSTSIYLNCKTNYVTVSEQRIWKDKKVLADLRPEIADEQIKRVIADEMYDCWYQMGAGEYDLFGKITSPKNCLTCAYIDFDDSYKTTKTEITDFKSFLGRKVPGTSTSYIQYLTRDAVKADKLNSKDLKIPDTLETQKSYAVVFISLKQNYWQSLTSKPDTVWEGVLKYTSLSGPVLTKDSSLITTILMPADEVDEVCEIMH